jgi:hypothetical protein
MIMHYFDPGNILYCMPWYGSGYIQSVDVAPDGDDTGFNWNIQFFSDTGCTNQVDESDDNYEETCVSTSSNAKSVYAWII